MRVNYHTHTQRCHHAQGSEEDYVTAAVRAKLGILGFSDHAPFPDHDYGLRMSYNELDQYLGELDRLKDTYSQELSIYKGLEIEYMQPYHKYYEDLLNKKKMDYLLLGEHFFTTPTGMINVYNDVTCTEIYIMYANTVAEALDTGLFKMVAHPDIIFMNQYPWDYNCETACNIIINSASKNKAILEYNANGYRRGQKNYPDGLRYQYPYMRFWEKVSRSDVGVVIGSDCHQPGQIWDAAMDKAYHKVEDMGMKPILTI